MIREQLADKYIRGRGIEIGGRHCPLQVPKGCLVSYVDRVSIEELKQEDKSLTIVENEIIIDDAEKLLKIESNSLDFIIANHVYEHTRNPLRTLECWWHKLRTGGIVYAAIPNKIHTFDHKRSVTTLEHLLEDYSRHIETDDEDHYRDWFTNVDHEKLTSDQIEERVKACVKSKANIHFHVWHRPAMEQIFKWAHDMGYFELLEIITNGGEEICILRATP